MRDHVDAGRRPEYQTSEEALQDEAKALAVCPGHELSHTFNRDDPALIQSLTEAWGPVHQLWEGCAADEALRYRGSSGGAASALALYALEQQHFYGVLHTAARDEAPHLNSTVMSHDRDALLTRTGSRYAPASPCEGLRRIEQSPGPCVFIGKPCDVAGARKAARLHAALNDKLALTIGFFCAGTPSTRGTLEMLKQMGVGDHNQLESLRYRGCGWPGEATAVTQNGDGYSCEHQLTYEQSWGAILSRHVQWRCKLCADHTGEFADIAVGDPWDRPIPPGEPGRSLILARTPRGRRFVEQAIEAGYLHAESADPSRLPASQPNLLRTRGAVWGRLWTSWLLGRAVPRYRGMPMFRVWWHHLSTREKARSTLGTVKRLFRRRRA
jgi:coenzyme F420 hydrogenase subunit beta